MEPQRIKQKLELMGVWKFTLRNEKTGKVRVYEYKNKIVNVGLGQILKALTNGLSATSDIAIQVSALGTGTNAPAAGDTTLQTEVARRAIASLTYSGTTMYVTAFYPAAGYSGTYREAGLFIDADAAVANDGILFSRVAINITKTELETLTIDYSVVATSS